MHEHEYSEFHRSASRMKAFTSPLPQLAGLVLWVCGAILAGSACQNAVACPLPMAQLGVSPRVALRRQRPGTPLQDPTGRNPLLRTAAPVGAHLVGVRQAGSGHRSDSQGRPDHRHRHQRPLPGLRHSRGLEHPPRHPERLLDGPHRGTAQGTGPSRSQGNASSCSATGVYPAPSCGSRYAPRAGTPVCATGITSPSAPTAANDCPRDASFPFPTRPGSDGAPPSAPPRPNAADPAGGLWIILKSSGSELVRSPLLGTGLQGHQECWKSRTDPTRVSRHWLVLSVATLLALAYGTRKT